MSRRSANTTKVFVGSLPAGTTAEELRQLFSPYGEIAECDVVNRCGFLHLEDKTLAFKAIDELNNTTFKGTRISVEKGRVKPPPNRDYSSGGSRGPRNGFGGPMRGGRDSYRGGPYMRDNDYDRRGPPRQMMGSNNYGGGYDRGNVSDRRPPMNDGYNSGPDRRYMDDRRNYDDRRYPESGYMGPGGDTRMYSDNHYADNRPPPIEPRPPFERRPVTDRNLRNIAMTDCPPAAPAMGATPPVGGNMHTPIPAIQPYDRRPQPDMYSRRDVPPKPIGNVGYSEPPRNPGYDTAPRNTAYDSTARNAGYDTAYPPLQPRSYAGGPAPPVRRY